MNPWKLTTLLGGGSATLFLVATIIRAILAMPPRSATAALECVADLSTLFGIAALVGCLVGAIMTSIKGERA